MDESYGKCRTCRLCAHSDDVWVCMPESRPTGPEDGCGRYRPGCCGSCRSWSGGMCSRHSEPRDSLDVCSDFDPAGSFRCQPVLPVRQDVLDAGLGLRIAHYDALGRFRDAVVDDVVAEGDVPAHGGANPGVGGLEGSDSLGDEGREPHDVPVDEGARVDVAGLGEQRVVGPVHEVVVQVVDRVHHIDGGGQLGEDVAQILCVEVAGYALERSSQAPAELPPHG